MEQKSKLIFYNGKYELVDHPLFKAADFPVISYYYSFFAVGTNIYFFDQQYQQIKKELLFLGYEIPEDFSGKYLQELMNRLITRNRFFKGLQIDLMIFKSPFQQDFKFILDTIPLPWEIYQLNKKGYKLDVYSEIRKSINVFSSISCSNLFLYEKAEIYRKKVGAEDVIILNEHDNISETLYGNIFFWYKGKLLTPSLSEGAKDNILRKQVIEIARKEKIEVEETQINKDILLIAEEVFTVNNKIGIRWIMSYHNWRYYHKISEYLNQLLIKKYS
ncbi:MAG: aminotransferase class IV [bacterium]